MKKKLICPNCGADIQNIPDILEPCCPICLAVICIKCGGKKYIRGKECSVCSGTGIRR